MAPDKQLEEFGKDRMINREMRRRKPPTDPKYTKSTQRIKKLRSKNAKKIDYLKRKLVRTRKASQTNNSQDA